MGDERETRADAKAAAAREKALRPWYKKKRFIIPLGLLLLIIIANLGGDSDDNQSQDTGDQSTENQGGGATLESTETEAGLNAAVRDGKFEFTVRGIQCGQTRVGNQFLNKTAQGQYCLLSVNVKNIGSEAQTLFGDNQKLFDSQGREFSSDSEAAIYAEDSKSIFEEINPGNAVDGQIYFDIPKDAAPAKVELHDSAFSGGVTVNLK